MHRLDAQDIQRLLEATPALFCKTSSDGRFLWLSKGWSELLGRPSEELLGKPFMTFVHPDDQKVTVAAMQQLDAGEAVDGFSNRYARADGSYVWIRWFSRSYDGYSYAIATVQEDGRDEATQLRETLRLLELTEELGEIGHWRVDLATNTLFWSKQVFKIYGLDPQDGPPDLESAIKAYHPEDQALVEHSVRDAIERKDGFATEMRLIRSDGQVRAVVSRGHVECNSLGEAISLIGIFQDVTDWKKMEARLHESERLHALSTLAAGVAHEINNPLQYITSTLEVMHAHLSADGASEFSAKFDELIADVEHGVEQVSQVVTELGTFVKQDAQESREPVSLTSVLNTTLSMTRNELRHRTRLTTRIGELPKVSASYSELVQVFVNLITNASQALEDCDGNCAMRISASTREDGWGVVEVEDTGPGIAPEDLTRIFEPFFTTKGTGKGTGLGLYLSRSIVNRHGGTITAESEPGRTRFRVALPPTAAPHDATPSEDENEKLPRILIIDDDPLVLRGLALMLEDAYVVTTESDPDAALQRLRVGQRFDVLLLDVMMPGQDGWAVLNEVSELAPELVRCTIVMTGALDPASQPKEFAETLVMVKPFRRKDILQRLQETRDDLQASRSPPSSPQP